MQIDSIQYFYCGNNTIKEDVFVASFNATNGNTQWVEILGNEGDEATYCIETDDEGSVYVPIEFVGDSTQIGNNAISRTNTHEYFATVLCKLNPLGLVEWTYLFDGKLNIHNTDFVNNNLYLSFLMNTDTLKMDTITYVNPTSRAGLFCKINSMGNLQWLSAIDTDIGNVLDKGLSTNNSGETIIYGNYSGSATFTYNSQVLDSSNNNIFYLKLSDNGNIVWYKSYLTTANPGVLSGITWGKQNDFYSIYKYLHQNAEITLGSYTLTDTSSQYAFITKMQDYSKQKVPLPYGWELVSSFIEPHNDSLEAVFDSVANNLIILKNNAGNVFWPQFGVNNISNWEYHQGYQSKMAVADSLLMFGNKIKPDTVLLQINAGWNIIPYFNIQPVAADSIFSGYINNVVIVKDGGGFVYWPQFQINSIGNMQAGKGYQIKAYQTFDFYYPPE